MDWDTLDIDLGAIDLDNSTYRITTDQTIAPLIASIDNLGLLNPPFLFPAENQPYMVVSGFKRMAACRELGHATIRARVLKPVTAHERLAEIAICENISQRTLNLVETSRALNLLAVNIHASSTFDRVCRRLGLPDHSAMRDKIMGVCRMPDAVQAGILEEGISLNTALALDQLAPETSAALAEIFRKLHLSHSKQRELLINLKDIARRDGMDPGALLQDAQLLALLSDPDTNHVQKANRLRYFFRTKRFPCLARTEEMFRKESKQLSLGSNIRFQPPAAFESREYIFTIGIKSLEDLETGIKNLQDTLNNPALQKILALKTT